MSAAEANVSMWSGIKRSHDPYTLFGWVFETRFWEPKFENTFKVVSKSGIESIPTLSLERKKKMAEYRLEKPNKDRVLKPSLKTPTEQGLVTSKKMLWDTWNYNTYTLIMANGAHTLHFVHRHYHWKTGIESELFVVVEELAVPLTLLSLSLSMIT